MLGVCRTGAFREASGHKLGAFDFIVCRVVKAFKICGTSKQQASYMHYQDSSSSLLGLLQFYVFLSKGSQSLSCPTGMLMQMQAIGRRLP